MHEHLQLQLRRRVAADGLYLFDRKLARQHHPLCAQLVCKAGRAPVGHTRLRGDVHRHLRRALPYTAQHAPIRHNKGVRPGRLRLLQKGGQGGKLFICGHGVQRDIQLFAPRVREGGALGQRLRRKVFRRAAHAEALARGIHGVRPVQHGKFQPLQIARRAKQFYLRQAYLPFPSQPQKGILPASPSKGAECSVSCITCPVSRKWGSSHCVLHLFGIEYPIPLRPELTAKAFLLFPAQPGVIVSLKWPRRPSPCSGRGGAAFRFAFFSPGTARWPSGLPPAPHGPRPSG